jgi:hypothetical protein
MTAFRVKVIKDHFPDTAAHVGQSKSIATTFAVMIHGGHKRIAITPWSFGEWPRAGAIG